MSHIYIYTHTYTNNKRITAIEKINSTVCRESRTVMPSKGACTLGTLAHLHHLHLDRLHHLHHQAFNTFTKGPCHLHHSHPLHTKNGRITKTAKITKRVSGSRFPAQCSSSRRRSATTITICVTISNKLT